MIRENWNLNSYQMKARGFAIYPERMKVTYPALGLAGEAGEGADKVKKIIRHGNVYKLQARKAMGKLQGDGDDR